MGQPKEGVVMPDGRRMIEHVIASLSQVCDRIVIVGTCKGFSIPSETGFLHLQDATPGMGPLAAVATLLRSGISTEGYLVTACDQPFLTADLLYLLVKTRSSVPRIFSSESEELPTPFPGYYPVFWYPVVEEGLQAGDLSVCNLIKKSAFSLVSLPKEWRRYLRNINRPDDLESVEYGRNFLGI